MLGRQDSGASLWAIDPLVTLTRGMLRGLRVESLPDVGLIGGGASLTTTHMDVVVKTVSLSCGNERFFHFVSVNGRIDTEEKLALAELFAFLLEVPADIQARQDPGRAVLFLRCNAASEAVLQNRVAQLGNDAFLASQILAALQSD